MPTLRVSAWSRVSAPRCGGLASTWRAVGRGLVEVLYPSVSDSGLGVPDLGFLFSPEIFDFFLVYHYRKKVHP